MPNLKFLIVDDVPFNVVCLQSVICQCLNGKYQVEIDNCCNGQEAIDSILESEKAGGKPYDIIFMDINMPVKDMNIIYYN